MSGFAYPPLTNSQLSTLPTERSRHRAHRLARLVSALRVWRKRRRELNALARLNDRELADFGASSADVYRELNTTFWRIPPTF
jgi:uncharacterized protein YjiS (DUF1127 family)